MKSLKWTPSERNFAYAGITLGMVVSLFLSPYNAYFFPNFAFFWASQLLTISLLFFTRPRAAAVAAMCVVVAVILVGVHVWIKKRTGAHPDGGAWLIYPVLLIGAAVGGSGASWGCGQNGRYSNIRVACITAMVAACGCVLSGAWACNSVFYCH